MNIHVFLQQRKVEVVSTRCRPFSSALRVRLCNRPRTDTNSDDTVYSVRYKLSAKVVGDKVVNESSVFLGNIGNQMCGFFLSFFVGRKEVTEILDGTIAKNRGQLLHFVFHGRYLCSSNVLILYRQSMI